MGRSRLATLLTLFLGSTLLIHAGMAWELRHMLRRGYPDFATFYTAGTMVRRGQGAQIYDVQAEYRVQQEFASQVTIRAGALQYLHPPFEAALFAPLTWLSYFQAYLLWSGINLLILGALPFLLRPYSVLLRERPWTMAVAALACFPIFYGWLEGQDTILLLALIALCYVFMKRQSEFMAGVCLGLGLIRFQFVLPLILLLLFRGRKRAILGSASVALLLVAISLLTVGWKEALLYPTHLMHIERVLGHGSIVPTDMVNLHGFFYELARRWASAGWIDALAAIGSIALFCFACISWNPAETGDGFDVGFFIALGMAVLVSYHGFLYDLSLLFLPLVLLSSSPGALKRADTVTRVFLYVAVAALLLGPLQILLWLRYHQASLLVPALLLGMWGMARLRPGKEAGVAAR